MDAAQDDWMYYDQVILSMLTTKPDNIAEIPINSEKTQENHENSNKILSVH